MTAPAGVSPEGLRFIAHLEGWRPRLYEDAAGHCTIGYGHLVHYGPIDGSEAEEFLLGITKERGLELLREDAEKAAVAVRESVAVPLTQPQFDALASFCFNVGALRFGVSTLCRLLNQGRYAEVPMQLARWTSAHGKTLPGLVRRRIVEARLFSRGAY